MVCVIQSRTSFLTGAAPSAASRQSRTAMRGFKDDFYSWKDSLSKDEQALLLKQAQNEFSKKFRKSDEFSQDLPEEKIQSFAKVLKKFFDNEKDDYKKEADQRTPDYDALKNKAALVSYDFGLKRRVVEIDRDADRRWMYASMKLRKDEEAGKEATDSSPREDAYKFSAETVTQVHKFLSDANSASSAPSETKADSLAKTVKIAQTPPYPRSPSMPFNSNFGIIFSWQNVKLQLCHPQLHCPQNPLSLSEAAIDKLLKETPADKDLSVRFPRIMHERLYKKVSDLQKDPRSLLQSRAGITCLRDFAGGGGPG